VLYKQNVPVNQSDIIFCHCVIPLFIEAEYNSSDCPEFSYVFILTFIFKMGQAKDFLEPLLEAKKSGLKLALHLSEVNSIALGWRGQITIENYRVNN
jgi:hypothetical protein